MQEIIDDNDPHLVELLVHSCIGQLGYVALYADLIRKLPTHSQEQAYKLLHDQYALSLAEVEHISFNETNYDRFCEAVKLKKDLINITKTLVLLDPNHSFQEIVDHFAHGHDDCIDVLLECIAELPTLAQRRIMSVVVMPEIIPFKDDTYDDQQHADDRHDRDGFAEEEHVCQEIRAHPDTSKQQLSYLRLDNVASGTYKLKFHQAISEMDAAITINQLAGGNDLVLTIDDTKSKAHVSPNPVFSNAAKWARDATNDEIELRFNKVMKEMTPTISMCKTMLIMLLESQIAMVDEESRYNSLTESMLRYVTLDTSSMMLSLKQSVDLTQSRSLLVNMCTELNSMVTKYRDLIVRNGDLSSQVVERCFQCHEQIVRMIKTSRAIETEIASVLKAIVVYKRATNLK
eukprot:gene19711-26402_t